jgi:hypothetical protein
MVTLTRFWCAALGLGLLGLWLTYYTNSPGMGSWAAWLNGAIGVAALIAAGTSNAGKTRAERATITGGFFVALFVVGILSLLSREQPGLIAWTFVFSAAFGVVTFIAAFETVGVVVRHPVTHAGDQPLHPRLVQPSEAPPPELTTEEIQELYGSDNLAGFEYQQRAGYLPPSPDHSHPFGVYWGVGPKGYLRADIQIADEISQKMAARGDLDASGIEVDVRLGVVTLRGSVETVASWRLAEALCKGVIGVKEIHNDLEVAEMAA